MKEPIVLDVESYPNYFLVNFMSSKGKSSIEIRGEDNTLSAESLKRLKSILLTRETQGFNSNKYDILMLFFALKGKTTLELNKLSDYIIEKGEAPWIVKDKFKIDIPKDLDHVDLYEVAPGVRVSLKLYGARMHSTKLQDLPIEPGTYLTEKEMDDTCDYCFNDLEVTDDLHQRILDRVQLRRNMSKEYDFDLRSKSDAQIAEVVIRKELKRLNPNKRYNKPKISPNTTFKYKVPHFIDFELDRLNEIKDTIANHDFELDGRGSIKLPHELKTALIPIGESKYQLGVGGLHSTEKSQVVLEDDDHVVIDKDVASYYPSIILNLELYPRQLGKDFLKVYRDIVDTRLKAKREKNKVVNESLKIVINGSFGKLGSKYSILYSPDLMMTVTLTGQLSLLMLIEKLELNGISVVSANTDGFVSKVPRDKIDLYQDICFEWELLTGFILEDTIYKALYSRDVNNYLAVKQDNTTKGKGIFSESELEKNPQAKICIEAVRDFLVDGVTLGGTIHGCKDVRKFLTARTVSGGAVWKGQYLGRVARWIYSTEGEQIKYKKNGNKVAKSEGARPIMVLGDFPNDIDYQRYIDESITILKTIGVEYV